MTIAALLVSGILLTILVGVGASYSSGGGRNSLWIPVATAAVAQILSIPLALRLFADGPIAMFGRVFVVDALSMYHLLLLNLVFLMAAAYATGYFRRHIEAGHLSATYVRRYGALWQVFHATLVVVLLSNNIGLMWVALELTTLVSAFLILSETESLSIEAMWKYLLVCSVGIVFAFMGTLLTLTAARQMPDSESALYFSGLRAHAELLDPKLILFAFIFIVVGYGTKAGLSPMHTWLPDAHSQAPTPVSAVFSGVMLNCALYCILRYLPIAEAASGGTGRAHAILLFIGFLSLLFSAVFIPVQYDIKRMLAYCSVEHVGIMAVGLGIGGLGTFAALLHTTNHCFAKVLSFFAAGQLAETYGTRDMRSISGAIHREPVWGSAFLISVLALIGVAPFSIFISELLTLKSIFGEGRYVLLAASLLCMLAIFMGMLHHALNVSFGARSSIGRTGPSPRLLDTGLVCLCVGVLLILGLWIPEGFRNFLEAASAAVEYGVQL